MAERVDLYDTAYANYAAEVYREVRLETYGEDFGQTSWVTTEESREIPKLLDLNTNSSVLEVGCGSVDMRYTLCRTWAAALSDWTLIHRGSQCEPTCGGERAQCAGTFRGV